MSSTALSNIFFSQNVLLSEGRCHQKCKWQVVSDIHWPLLFYFKASVLLAETMFDMCCLYLSFTSVMAFWEIYPACQTLWTAVFCTGEVPDVKDLLLKRLNNEEWLSKSLEYSAKNPSQTTKLHKQMKKSKKEGFTCFKKITCFTHKHGPVS